MAADLVASPHNTLKSPPLKIQNPVVQDESTPVSQEGMKPINFSSEGKEGRGVKKVENHDGISDYEKSRNANIRENQRILERIMKSNIRTPAQKEEQKEGNLYVDE